MANPTKLVDGIEVVMTDQEVQALADEKAAYKVFNDARQAAEAARQLDLAELASAKADAALTVIAADVTEINTDIANVGTATNTEVRNMLARSLAREKKARQREQAIIKALMRLINQ